MTCARACLRSRGFALLIVLWTLALLSLLVAHMAAAGRSESRIAFNLRSRLEQDSILDGAVYAAVFHLLDRSAARWSADGIDRQITSSGGTVTVRVTDEADRVNINTASADLLRALFLGFGQDAANAAQLAGAVVDWRENAGPDATAAKAARYHAAGLGYLPPEKPLTGIDELALVLGMTPDLLARLRPHITIYSSYGPGRASADQVVRGAVLLLRREGGLLPFEADPTAGRVIRVAASLGVGIGGSFTRHAVLRIDPGAKDRPCAILAWDD